MQDVDVKQLDAVDAGKPFVRLQEAGIKTATMDHNHAPEGCGTEVGRGRGSAHKRVRRYARSRSSDSGRVRSGM